MVQSRTLDILGLGIQTDIAAPLQETLQQSHICFRALQSPTGEQVRLNPSLPLLVVLGKHTDESLLREWGFLFQSIDPGIYILLLEDCTLAAEDLFLDFKVLGIRRLRIKELSFQLKNVLFHTWLGWVHSENDYSGNGLYRELNYGFALIDTDGMILYANPGFNEINAQLNGIEVPGILSVYPGMGAGIQESVNRNMPWSGKMHSEPKAGEPKQIACNVYPLGNPVRFCMVFLNDTTPGYFLSRSREQFDQLQVLGTMAGGIVHDFKNLLQSFSTFQDLLYDTIENEPYTAMRYLEKMRGEIRRGKVMLDSLLDFVHDSEVTVPCIDMGSSIQEILNHIQTTIPSGMKLIPQILDTGSVRFAPQDLYRVIQNLINNAVQASEGFGDIYIILRRVHPGANEQNPVWMELSVRDEGKGMDPSELKMVFQPFYTTRKVQGGLGLGLSGVMGLVSASGGFVDVDSKPGEGSVFRIMLPLCN